MRPETAHRASSRWRAGALLAVVTLVAYRPALQAGFIWDDDDYVTANETLQDAEGLRRIWTEPGVVPQYYPLTFTSLWLDHQVWGLDPMGYHLTNVFLHALNAVLVWVILERLAVPAAWLAAALFAVHPVHVESVAWITERKNVLSGVFYLSSLLVFLRCLPVDGAGADGRIRWRAYALATALFLGALLSKTVAASLPVVIGFVVWWKRGRVDGRTAAALLPLGVLGAALGLLTISLERHNVGAVGPEWEFALVERCLIAGRALWFYVWKLAWPARLTFSYPRWTIDATAWWQYLYPAAAAAVVVVLWRRRARLGRGPLVAVLFFAVTLAPALGFVDVFPMRFSFVADHFQYLASLGPIALAAATATVALARRGRPGVVAGRVLGAALVATYVLLVWRQLPIYESARTLWVDTLTKNPDSGMAHNNLGVILLEEGRPEDAAVHFREALRAKADDVSALNNLGNAYVLQGRAEEALARYREALRIAPDDASVRVNLGSVLAAMGRPRDAIAQYAEAIRIEPTSPLAHGELAIVLLATERLDEAIEHLAVAVRLDPDDAMMQHRLGEALARAGRIDEAVAAEREALRLAPDLTPAREGLAALLHRADPEAGERER